MIRTLVLRILGLLVAAALGVAATSLVAFGLERRVTALSGWIESFVDWIAKPPLPGAAVLAGTGLLILAVAIIWLVAARRIRGVRTLEKTASGSTDIDMGSVAATLERKLRNLDPKVQVTAMRSRLRITAPSKTGDRYQVADEATRRVQEELERMGLTGTPFAVRVGERVPESRVT